MRVTPSLVIILSFLSAAPALSQDAPDLPLWEIGVGGVARTGPDYPGSSEYRGDVAVYPYITYRGRLLEIGGDQTFRFIPIRTDRLEFGISIDGSSAVDSRDNALRGALPDLDALVEFGPEISYRVAETDALFGRGDGRVEMSLQTRGVFSVGSGIDHVGNLVRPAIRYRQNGALVPGSRISASIGPVFATEGVHDFFYETPDYDAGSGYLGTEIAASIRYPISDRVNIVGGVGVTVLSGAENRASPLFEEDVNASAFVGLTYSLFQSRRRAVRDR